MGIDCVMYANRRYHLKKKKLNGKAVALVMLAAAVLFLQKDNHSVGKMLVEECKIACYQEVLELYMPGVVNSVNSGEKQTVVDLLVSHIFPGQEEERKLKNYETQVESDISYETILAREAADENYVDEKTGKVVQTENASAEALPETGTSQGEKEADEVAKNAQVQKEAPVDVANQAIGESGKAVTYSREKLNDFDYLLQNFYKVDSTTTIDSSQLNAQAVLGKDVRISHDASTPQILIYHTHSQEAYADSVPGDKTMTVVGVGEYLTKLLTEKYGFNVIHHTGEYDVDDRDHAYAKAGPALEQILAENPDIDVVIDLHRDGVGEGTRLVTDVNGSKTAQIMFFNGLSRTTSTGDIAYLKNPYIADNLAISFQMQLKAAEYYPGFSRKIYLKGYRYNMHYCPKTLLIEVGAQTNTVQEAMNAMIPLADILNKVLTGPQ